LDNLPEIRADTGEDFRGATGQGQLRGSGSTLSSGAFGIS
jgi:hypothetical protein